MRCCFSPKYLLAAAVITAGVWLVAPQAALPAGVVLIALSCPISMFLAMRKPQGAFSTETGSNNSTERDPQLDEQIRALRTEIEDLRGQREKA